MWCAVLCCAMIFRGGSSGCPPSQPGTAQAFGLLELHQAGDPGLPPFLVMLPVALGLLAIHSTPPQSRCGAHTSPSAPRSAPLARCCCTLLMVLLCCQWCVAHCLEGSCLPPWTLDPLQTWMQHSLCSAGGFSGLCWDESRSFSWL